MTEQDYYGSVLYATVRTDGEPAWEELPPERAAVWSERAARVRAAKWTGDIEPVQTVARMLHSAAIAAGLVPDEKFEECPEERQELYITLATNTLNVRSEQ